MQVPGLTRSSSSFSFQQTILIMFAFLSLSFLFHFSFSFYSYPSSVMPHNANDTNVGQALTSPGAEDTSQVVEVNAASGTWVLYIEFGHGFSSWSVTEYKTRSADTLDALQFGAVFFIMCQPVYDIRRIVHRYSDSGLLARRWMILRRLLPGKLKDVFGFDMLILCHAEEVGYLLRLLRFVWNFDVTNSYRGLDLSSFEIPIDWFYLLKEANARWRELKFEGRL